MKSNDLTGQTFGQLTVIKRSAEKSKCVKWECVCSCGKTTIVSGTNLRTGKTKSCGCLKVKASHDAHFKDLTGKKFGRWTVLSLAPKRGKRIYWLCKCNCGNISEVESNNLSSGKSLSCGCLSIETTKENNYRDITGKRFGKLITLYRVDGYDALHWKCKCDCGNYVDVRANCLLRGTTKSCGCLSNLKDITGQKFGKLLVKYRVDNKDGRTMWHCLCDCGKEVDVRSDYLLCGEKKSCGCILSYGELVVRDILDKYSVSYKREYMFRDSEIPTYRYDFAILNIDGQPIGLIEFDGIQHYIPTAFGSDQSWETKVANLSVISKRDLQKNMLAFDMNLPLLRIKYDEKNIEDVIIKFLKAHDLFVQSVDRVA